MPVDVKPPEIALRAQDRAAPDVYKAGRKHRDALYPMANIHPRSSVGGIFGFDTFHRALAEFPAAGSGSKPWRRQAAAATFLDTPSVVNWMHEAMTVPIDSWGNARYSGGSMTNSIALTVARKHVKAGN